MDHDQLKERILGLHFRGPVEVQHVAGNESVCARLAIGEAGRTQNVEIRQQDRYLVVRSKVCKYSELNEGDPLIWTLTENASTGLGAVVVHGAYVWIEMALLADHVHDPELALAIEAVGLEADQLEAKATEGRNRF
jgi:hypothetical protein